MQRTWMRALIFVAVGAASGLVTSEAEAQGPVRRLFRRMFGRDNVVTNAYVNPNANRVVVREGYTTGSAYGTGRVNTTGTVDASGRWIGPMDRTARGGARVDTRFNGQAAPATRIDANANIRAPAGANVRGEAGAPAEANLNRNEGSIRANADADLRGDVTPPDASAPATPDALPPPVPTP